MYFWFLFAVVVFVLFGFCNLHNIVVILCSLIRCILLLDPSRFVYAVDGFDCFGKSCSFDDIFVWLLRKIVL